jgi:flagellar basal-body rod protein FlgC
MDDSMYAIYKVISSGMSAQKTRMEIVNTNLANINTTRTGNGEGPYKRRDVVFKSNKLSNGKIGVKVDSLIVDEKNFIYKYEPNHPDSNKEGYVAYPNINAVAETHDLIESSRAYETNIEAFKTQKTIDLMTIDLLKE